MKSFNETGLSHSWQAAWLLFVLSKSDPSPSRLLSIAASPINALHHPPSCIPQWQPIPWLPAVTSSCHDPGSLAALLSMKEISFGCVSFLWLSVAVAVASRVLRAVELISSSLPVHLQLPVLMHTQRHILLTLLTNGAVECLVGINYPCSLLFH